MQQHSCQHGKEKKTLRLDRYRPSIFESLLRIDPPSRAIKEWILDDEPDLGWFNCPRNSHEPDPDSLDQRPTWQAPEIHLDDGRTLVLESN
jgi:hypothetical protein